MQIEERYGRRGRASEGPHCAVIIPCQRQGRRYQGRVAGLIPGLSSGGIQQVMWGCVCQVGDQCSLAISRQAGASELYSSQRRYDFAAQAAFRAQTSAADA